MKKIYLKIIIICLSTIIFQENIYAQEINPHNKVLIESFRAKYINSQHENTEYNQEFINNKNRVKRVLLNMAEIDQKVRTEVWEKVAYVCQKKNLDCTNDYNQVDTLVTEIDTMNLSVLKLFMTKYPWFKISEFGEDGAKAAWLIVQHSNDIDLKARTIFIMQSLLESGEADKQSYALLYDRLSLEYKEFGIKQRYGSQFLLSEDRKKLIFEPCDGSIDQVEARRKEYGMIPLRENVIILAKENSIVEVVGLDLP